MISDAVPGPKSNSNSGSYQKKESQDDVISNSSVTQYNSVNINTVSVKIQTVRESTTETQSQHRESCSYEFLKQHKNSESNVLYERESHLDWSRDIEQSIQKSGQSQLRRGIDNAFRTGHQLLDDWEQTFRVHLLSRRGAGVGDQIAARHDTNTPGLGDNNIVASNRPMRNAGSMQLLRAQNTFHCE